MSDLMEEIRKNKDVLTVIFTAASVVMAALALIVSLIVNI